MYTKILLTLATLGVWIVVILNLIAPSAPTQKQFSFCTIDDNGAIAVGGTGSISFTAAGLKPAIEVARKEGWKIHSIVSPSGSGGYVIFVEK